ncbi:MAG: plastocyanin/azurin family copper-binding protein, partial [Candidatus Limnocylindrales bacterium]
MKSLIRFIVVLMVVSLVAMACVSGAAPSWTFTPGTAGAAGSPGASPSMGDMPGMSGMPGMGDMPGMGSPAASAPAGQDVVASGSTVEIHAFDLGFRPSAVAVASAGTYALKFVNDGAVEHNITFADGTVLVAQARQTTTGSVSVPAAGMTFLCSIPGHAQAGMTGAISVG